MICLPFFANSAQNGRIFMSKVLYLHQTFTVCLSINIHILICWRIRCNYKLWKVLWFNWLISTCHPIPYVHNCMLWKWTISGIYGYVSPVFFPFSSNLTYKTEGKPIFHYLSQNNECFPCNLGEKLTCFSSDHVVSLHITWRMHSGQKRLRFSFTQCYN